MSAPASALIFLAVASPTALQAASFEQIPELATALAAALGLIAFGLLRRSRAK